MKLTRRAMGLLVGASLLASSLLAPSLLAQPVFAQDWGAVAAEARGQTVYWHAWGGDPKINDFIAFMGAEAQARYGVRLKHVKLASTADAVARVLAERDAGHTTGGAVDLIWINGENFAAMKAHGLLHGPFAQGFRTGGWWIRQANPRRLPISRSRQTGTDPPGRWRNWCSNMTRHGCRCRLPIWRR